MKCTNCGVQLTSDDLFCPNCGAKVIKDRRCPECGALLREDTNFCHRCGRKIEEKKNSPQAGSREKNKEETLDIPIDVIERNILSETAAEIRADQRDEETPSYKNMSDRGASSHKSASTGSAQSSRKSVSSGGAASAKKTVYKTEKDRDEDDEDWDDDDWEDEAYDEGAGPDIITVMTAVVGCVILVIIAVLGFHFYRQYTAGDQENEAEVQQEGGQTASDAEAEEEGAADGGNGEESGNMTLTVVRNVNVRDYPSTSDSNVLKVAKSGETYPCTGSVDDGQWYMILLEDGATGYVFHEYVTVE